MKSLLFFALSLAIFSCAACSVQPVPDPRATAGNSDGPEKSLQVKIENPYAPQAEDNAMAIKNAYLDDMAWDADARTLRLTGSLPTPCNQLRISTTSDSSSLVITVYSVYPPDSMCAQVLEPFEAVLTITSVPAEINQFIINGQIVEI